VVAVSGDWWLEDGEKKALLDFHAEHPLESYRRLAFMGPDADVVAGSPSNVYRMLSDIDMPRMDGIQLVAHIKQDPRLKAFPVVIVSYKDREEYRIRGLDAGANCDLTKTASTTRRSWTRSSI
jgi:CheY-like chemotaxis protein